MALNPATGKPETSTRTESFVWGIPQNGLQHKEREVAQDEPPPPAVIEEPNATTLIHPGDVATVSDAGHLVINVKLA